MNYASFQAVGNEPLHAQLRDWLCTQLADYSLEAKLPTDRELAKRLNVAPLTVKRAMTDLERDGFVSRQQGRGTFLTSRERRVHAKQERAAANGEVVLAYPNYFSYEYWARAHHAEAAALKAGYGLVEFKINPSTTYESLIELVKRHKRTRAVLISPVPGSIDRHTFTALDALNVPVVVFSHCDYVSLGRNVYAVVPDWYKSGYRRTELLLEQGHEQIGWIANEPPGQDGGDALKGCRQCLRDRGVSSRNVRSLRRTTKAWEDSTEAGYNLCEEMLAKEEVSALVVDSMAGAVGCLHCLWKHRIDVPGEMSLVSGGSVMPVERYLNPPITTVCSSYADELAIAFNVIHNPPDSNRVLRSDVVLESGESIAAPAKLEAV